MVACLTLCLFVISPGLLVDGKQTTWGHRDFKTRCDSGARLTGHTLQVLDKIKSKSRCLTQCFDHPECQSINYLAGRKECHLSDASSVDLTEDEKFIYCEKDDGEVWERTAKTKLIPDIDDCLAASCLNGATCNDGMYSFTCTCVAGFSGPSCETDINECSPNPCMNGATCVEGLDSFQCTCAVGYTGTSCQQTNVIRLVDGTSPIEGRVEVFYGGQWGTVCDDLWELNDGQVACKQLGYQSASEVWQDAHFGEGMGSIHLDNVECTGAETSLWNCTHEPWGSHNCGHDEDASIRCNI